MTLSIPRTRHYLQNFEFQKLFKEELGWDYHSALQPVTVDGETYTLRAFAQKRGVQIFECPPNCAGQIPSSIILRKIDMQVGKHAHEHLIIFVDAQKTTQVWQWVAREPGQPARTPKITLNPHRQSGDLLIQKLRLISFSVSEEEAIDLFEVTRRLKDAVPRDTVTKRFYDHFKREHAAFLEFITGITGQADREWYTSLMLNRLMFIYFIQKKGFLDGHTGYLRDRLEKVQERKGSGKFQTFYRYFLLCLFHQGLSCQPPHRKVSKGLAELLGKVPYLNGGLFDVHELETRHDKIDIPDEAFERLFDFFDKYEWHLDTRPLCNGHEINPDVLGYIFEKYINQKQMGAYYTKEDITGYISKNTIIPHVFDVARKKCAIAFEPGSPVWRQLADNPDRYLYRSVRHGVLDDQGEVIPLSTEIQKGVQDVSCRDGWNRSAPAEYALPTETWREHVARRQRCLALREKVMGGQVSQIKDLVTCNLDIRQFAEDTIESCEGPELLRAFYHGVSTVTVLDPTCGSGAFLFAALNVLQLLYAACLDRMQAFVDDLDRSGEAHSPKKFEDFRRILADVARHPNRDYFILKSIIVNNLYGVDIMREAVEICKLRLFLKLVAQVDARPTQDNFGLEPLPDIDFNIRPGNTLVGFATLDDARKAMVGWMDFKNDLPRIVEEAEIVDRAFAKFHQMQTAFGMDGKEFTEAKQDLRRRLDQMAQALDRCLAGQYGIDTDNPREYAEWQSSHQPFHWFADFYGIMRDGGFDVIIGNPPYLEKAKLGGLYTVQGYQTANCRDIYSWCVERATQIIDSHGRLGLIVPVSIVSSENFSPLRKVLSQGKHDLWFSHFANRPGQLFAGGQNRLTIFLRAFSDVPNVFSTRYHRWDGRNGERDTLFDCLCYVALPPSVCAFHGLFPKVGVPEAVSVLAKLLQPRAVSDVLLRQSDYPIYWVRVPGYFCQFFLRQPLARPESGGGPQLRGEVNEIHCRDERTQRSLHAILNSSIWYQFFTAFTDGRHVNPSDVKDFPCDLNSRPSPTDSKLKKLSKRLESSMRENTSSWRKSGLLIESVDSRETKPILDQIDAVLAGRYGFDTAELDYIINYDIKYRMGQEEAEAHE
jgi:hypothetical protein